MKTVALSLLLSMFALAQQPGPSFRVATSVAPCECPAPLSAATSTVFQSVDTRTVPDECSREKLLSAIQKASKQLPDADSLTGTMMTLTASGVWIGGQYDKYAGKPYIERLKAIAADKEQEAREARETANREETREADIKLIKRLAKECF